MPEKPFSQDLENWLKSKRPKTLEDLRLVFGEKAIAITLLLLLAPSSLPLPTGGITNVLEIIALFVCTALIMGRRTIWLPKFLRTRKLGHAAETKVIPFLIKRVRWFERFSRPRFRDLMHNQVSTTIIGVFLFIYTLGALLAVPFTGLDTLPSLGVVIISLSIILEDVVLLLVGVLVGTIGIGVQLALSSAVTRFIF